MTVSFQQSILAAVLLLAATAQAQEAKCPSTHEKKPLATISIFDGPPSEQADLAPDVEKGSGDHIYNTWNVGDLGNTGRDLFLVCRYAGLSDAQVVTIKLDKTVRSCFLRTHGKSMAAEAECK